MTNRADKDRQFYAVMHMIKSAKRVTRKPEELVVESWRVMETGGTAE